MDMDRIELAERRLQYRFNDRALLLKSLTHASTVDARLESNERLEFLGDSILGVVVCDYLFREFAGLLEGEMTKIKSSIVSRQVCAQVAAELGLDELLYLGKGMSNRSSLPESVLAAVYESVIGALYLDAGMERAQAFILRNLEERILAVSRSGHQHNFKSVLQQIAQQMMGSTPHYLLLDEQGPDHAKCFEICVEIANRRFESCWGPNKKAAEQQAALLTLQELGAADIDDNGAVMLIEGSDLDTDGVLELD